MPKVYFLWVVRVFVKKWSKIIDRHQLTDQIEVEQFFFVREVLHAIGIDNLPNEIKDFDVKNKILFRKSLDKFNLTIESSDNKLVISLLSDGEKQLIAEWYEPMKVLRSNSGSSKKFFEVFFKCKSVMELK